MRLLFAVLASSALASCQLNSSKETETEKKDTMANTTANTTPAANTLTDAQKSEGWQLLFDGTTKNGWHVYSKKTDGSSWKVADGVLYLDTSGKKEGRIPGGGDLVSDEEFENFHLKMDWRVSPKGNSGIMFNVKEEAKYENTYHTGPEMQVLDNAGHPDANITKHRAGDLYDLISASPEVAKGAGEWNTAEIILNKGALEFHLNGSKVVTTTLWDDSWKKMVAASKFKQWPDFGTFRQGRIALQDHGDMIEYRNIVIKKL